MQPMINEADPDAILYWYSKNIGENASELFCMRPSIEVAVIMHTNIGFVNSFPTVLNMLLRSGFSTLLPCILPESGLKSSSFNISCAFWLFNATRLRFSPLLN
jgi:hypothetical protein